MRIYLDTNVLVLAVEGSDADDLHRALWELMSHNPGLLQLVTSELSLAEVLVKPLELGLAKVASTYCELVTDRAGLGVIPVDRDILILAARIRGDDRSIKLPDAIHLATAEREYCSMILTDDQQLTRKRPHLCRSPSVETINDIMRESS
jgi:predicted nucleic acid-binding protein